jgi:hypothetical protein
VTTKENIRRANCIPVVQFKLDGTYVREFRSLDEAGKELGIFSSGIGDACYGRTKSSNGFLWAFKKDYIQDSVIKPYKRRKRIDGKPVIQFTCNDEFLAEFTNIVSASRITKIDKTSISRCCSKYHGALTAGGFKWKFKSDYHPNS